MEEEVERCTIRGLEVAVAAVTGVEGATLPGGESLRGAGGGGGGGGYCSLDFLCH